MVMQLFSAEHVGNKHVRDQTNMSEIKLSRKDDPWEIKLTTQTCLRVNNLKRGSFVNTENLHHKI